MERRALSVALQKNPVQLCSVNRRPGHRHEEPHVCSAQLRTVVNRGRVCLCLPVRQISLRCGRLANSPVPELRPQVSLPQYYTVTITSLAQLDSEDTACTGIDTEVVPSALNNDSACTAQPFRPVRNGNYSSPKISPDQFAAKGAKLESKHC